MTHPLHIGFHYHTPAIKVHHQIRMQGSIGSFVNSLAENCEYVICFLHSPKPDEKILCQYQIKQKNVALVDLGPHTSIPNRLLRSRFIVKKFSQNTQNLDLLLVRSPTPLFPIITSRIGDLPLALLLVGDHLKTVDYLKQPKWRKELIRIFWQWNKRKQIKVAQRSLLFVNSRELFNELNCRVPHLVEVHTTTLSHSDFFDRQDTCKNAPYRLLYTGRMDRTKGLIDIIEALALLNKNGEEVILDLVGWTQVGDNIINEILSLAQSLGVADRVYYHGFKPFGPELFQYYIQADIYVIPSYAEGFPRSIWEAMAHSLPIIATSVGSIPFYLRDGETASLIPPRMPNKLAHAIKDLIHSKTKRQLYIKNCQLIARQVTLEKQTQKMINSIEEYLRSRKK